MKNLTLQGQSSLVKLIKCATVCSLVVDFPLHDSGEGLQQPADAGPDRGLLVAPLLPPSLPCGSDRRFDDRLHRLAHLRGRFARPIRREPLYVI